MVRTSVSSRTRARSCTSESERVRRPEAGRQARILIGLVAFSLLGTSTAAIGAEPNPTQELAKGVFGVLPTEAKRADNPLGPKKIELGRRLYFDKRLSQSGEISCNSCHDLARFGVDGEPTSPGHEGQRGERNSPTVYNAALHISQFWDGREPNVEEQAKGPILNPIEMAMPTGDAVVELLKSIPEYPPLFAAAFPEDPKPLTYDNVGMAIGAFERRLITPSRFDKFLAGDASALTPEEAAGLQLFMDTGCIMCHSGATVGGTMYQKIGLVKPYPTKDLGRYEVTKREADKYVFKVPSLRNIARTGPYFHDGSVKTLKQAISLMGTHQLGVELSQAQIDSIAIFLASLTGEIDPGYIVKP